MTFSIIAAVARDGAIGITRHGVPGLPWPTLRQDMAFFSGVTQSWDPLAYAQEWCAHGERGIVLRSERDNALIVGHRTYTSWGAKPLPHRKTIILRDKTSHGAGDWPCKARSLGEALDKAQAFGSPHTFVAGGARLYTEALRHPDCERLYLTEVDAAYPEADTHWPSATHMSFQSGIMHVGMVSFNVNKPIKTWHRTACSAWITEPERPRYRFSVWEKPQ